ncbi:hypothetical protein [Anoxynatronum sibiricum]|uniref:hypothetical protein n=1 Tax=Anoxynatronum sibiricum TaxID=210623 RepID=UPI0031B8A995
MKQKLEADEQLVEKLFQQETPEEVQALLKENDVDLTIEEIGEVRGVLIKALERAEEGELSEEDLEEVTGGCFAIAFGVTTLVLFIAAKVTGWGLFAHTESRGRW